MSDERQSFPDMKALPHPSILSVNAIEPRLRFICFHEVIFMPY